MSKNKKSSGGRPAPIANPKMAEESIDHLKNNFGGLETAVKGLPEGGQRTTIMSQLAETYLWAAKTICQLAGGNFVGAPVAG